MENLKTMLEAGVHFGHQVRRWNPKMAPYIYEEKNGVHILDVIQTAQALEVGQDVVSKSKNILFVGTKRQSAALIASVADSFNSSQAADTHAHYVNHRWLGGLLTNWSTMSTCIKKLRTLSTMDLSKFSKKEAIQIQRQRERLEKFFGGVRNLSTLPDLVVIVGQPNEMNAVRECQKLNIKCITLLDSNCDPDLTDIGIPANDDSLRSVSYILNTLIS